MQFLKNISVIGWGDVPTDPSRSYSNERVIGMIEAKLMDWLSKPNKTAEEQAQIPKRLADLQDIREMTSERWKAMTGIESRQYYMDDSIWPYHLAQIAGENALKVAEQNHPGFSRDKISLVAGGSSSFGDAFPGASCREQDYFGIPNAGAIDLTGACCSGTEAFIVASSLLQLGAGKFALIALGEKTGSWCADRMDKNSLLWGDGGSAVVLYADPNGDPDYGLIDFDMKSYGHLADTTRSCGIGAHPDHRLMAVNASMEGQAKKLQRWVRSDVTDALHAYIEGIGLVINDRTFLLPHNGNIVMAEGLAEKLGIPPDRVLHRLIDHGNQSSVAIFSTLAYYANLGLFKKGDTLILATFGGGAKHNFVVIRWP